MPKTLPALFFVLIFMPLWAHAEAILTADSDIKVLSINGKAVSQGLFGSNKSFAIPAGSAVIDARYERLYEQGKDHEIVRSADLSLEVVLQDKQSYHLSLPAAPKDLQNARKYAKTLQLSLLDAQGITLSQSHVSATQSSGFLGLGNLSSLFTHDEDTFEAFKALWSKASEEERNKIRSWLK